MTAGCAIAGVVAVAVAILWIVDRVRRTDHGRVSEAWLANNHVDKGGHRP